ncbi:MAG TPA: hypothetical protein VGL77_03665 [Armatimonadota bacterium]|jgi:hypothetical protein
MANYTATMTASGLALLQAISNAGGTLEFMRTEAGDGALGSTDPATLTALIAPLQTNAVVDAQQDDAGEWYAFVEFSNANVAAGYLRREMGVYARLAGNSGSETLLVYFNALDAEADYIPATDSGTAMATSFAVKIAQSAGLQATVTIDQSTAYLPLDRWAQHLAGGGGVDQHPLATAVVPGLMPAADKAALGGHIGYGGLTQHPAATITTPGFLSVADKQRLDALSKGWRFQLAYVNGTSLATFNASTKYDFGVTQSSAGELIFDIGLGHPVLCLWSMVVHASVSTVVTMPVFMNDDSLYIYIDGTIQQTLGASETQRDRSFAIPAGDHVVQVLLNNSGGGEISLLLGPWIPGTVTWLRAATV